MGVTLGRVAAGEIPKFPEGSHGPVGAETKRPKCRSQTGAKDHAFRRA